LPNVQQGALSCQDARHEGGVVEEERMSTDVHDMIRDLTTEHRHAEPYTFERNGEQWQTRHHTVVPALIHQLVGVTDTTNGTGEEAGSNKSKPAARIELLDTLILIDTEAGEWLDRLGYTIPANKIDPRTHHTIVGSGCILALSRLNGLYPSTDSCGRQSHPRLKGEPWCCARGHLGYDIRRWWHQARIITGWDTPAFKPRATCPVCDAHGSLRVKPDGALCVECRSLWDAQQIGLLAEHIRSENQPEEAA
jgi:hypothetical protein